MNDPAAPPTDQTGQADSGPSQSSGPRVSSSEMKDLSRLRRTVEDRHIAGVAGGVARHFDVDPIIMRVAFVVLAFFGGAGLLLYFAAWLFVPEEGSEDRPLGLDDRSRTVALIGVGVLALLAAVGDWAGAYWFPWPIAIVAVGVVWFLHRKDSAPAAQWSPYAAAPDSAATGLPPMQPIDYSRIPPRNPRKRGPVLLWFTLALIALGEGVLLVVDQAGLDILPSAYPALALAISAGMLVLGAFWGRAGGLIMVALLAAGLTWATAVSETWESESIRHAPTLSSEVRDSYEMRSGELVLDLTGLTDPGSLTGQEISIDGGVGKIEVVVPSDLDVDVETDIGVGSSNVFDTRSEGLGVTRGGEHAGGDGVTDINITIDLGVGEVVVREQGGTR